MLQNTPFFAIKSLLQAFPLLRAKGIKSYVFWPLGINLLLFAALQYGLLTSLDTWLANVLPSDGVMQYLSYLVLPLAFLAILVVSALLFNWVAAIIAAPFLGLLAEAVAARCSEDFKPSNRSLLTEVRLAFAREWLKIRYYLPKVVLLLLLSLIPVVNLVMPLVWVVWGAWMLSVQYLDIPADNRQQDFTGFLLVLKKRRLTVLVFGGCVMLLLMIPIVNFVMIPTAVIAATLLWESFRTQVGD